uniref:Uncharacterized protein n=1 Tax=Anopheles culicifacies TaxID=139723 RepID=A0A182MX36_9DIPT
MNLEQHEKQSIGHSEASPDNSIVIVVRTEHPVVGGNISYTGIERNVQLRLQRTLVGEGNHGTARVGRSNLGWWYHHRVEDTHTAIIVQRVLGRNTFATTLEHLFVATDLVPQSQVPFHVKVHMHRVVLALSGRYHLSAGQLNKAKHERGC